MRTARLSSVRRDGLTSRTSLWKTMVFLSVLSVTSPAVMGQPVLSYFGMANAASGNRVSGLYEAFVEEIAQGSMFVISGRGLGPAEPHRAQDLPLPSELAGSSVSVTVGTTTRNAVVVYASAGLVAGILPIDVPPGDGSFSVTYNGQTSTPGRVRVVRRAFGIFTESGAGVRPALVQNIGPEGDQRFNTLTNAARPGQVVVLWGTGLGPVRSDPSARPFRARTPSDPNAGLEVLVGNTTARTLYAGPSGCCAGIDQIIFEAPAGVEGCFVPIAVRFRDGEVGLNFATMSIAAQGGTCSDPHGLSATQVQRLQAGEFLNQGSIRLRGYFGRSVHMTGQFARYNLVSHSMWEPLPPFGSCLVSSRDFSAQPFALQGDRPLGAARAENLDAGQALNLRTPQADTRVPLLPGTLYQQPWPGTLPWEGGAYTVDNGAGSAEVGSFRATIQLPPDPFRWSNLPDPNQGHEVSSSQDLTITWSGGDRTGEYVVISGGTDDGVSPRVSSFTCTERAGGGDSPYRLACYRP